MFVFVLLRMLLMINQHFLVWSTMSYACYGTTLTHWIQQENILLNVGEYFDSKFDCSAAALLILDACQIWGKLDNQTWRSGLTDSQTLLWECIQCTRYTLQGLKLTLIPRSDFLLLLSKSWSKSDCHRSYFCLKADIWLDWVAKLCS